MSGKVHETAILSNKLIGDFDKAMKKIGASIERRNFF